MAYIKKILIFNEADKNFAAEGKSISGVLKLEKTGLTSTACLFISNFNVKILGEIKCVLKVGREIYCESVTRLNEFSFNIKNLEFGDGVDCVMAICQGKSYLPFAVASTYRNKASALELLNQIPVSNKYEINEFKIKDAEAEAPMTEYEKFVAKTDNYFENKEWEFENPKQGKDTFQKIFSGGDYINKVNLSLETIFEKYPPCEELSETVKNSLWAKIPCKDENYFAIGVISAEDKAMCLCYAVPSKEDKKPSDKDFFLIKTEKTDFWVLCQNAQTGSCETDKFKFLFAKTAK